MKYLPSKKFVITVIFFLLAGGAFFVFFGSSNTTIQKGFAGLSIGEKSAKDDADNDGLASWEEALLGTDPQNPDSNQNGIPDGEEFASVKKYLNIELDERAAQGLLSFEGRLKSLENGGSINLTDAITQETALRYGVLGAGNQLDEPTFNQLLNSLTSDFSGILPKDPYTTTNLSFSQKTDTPAVNFYISSVIVALNEYPMIYEKNPIDLLSSWVRDSNTDNIQTLHDLGESYVTLAKRIKNTTAPATLARTHIALANTLFHISNALLDMARSPEDPIRALLGAAAYVHHEEARRATVTDLVSIFNTNNQ